MFAKEITRNYVINEWNIYIVYKIRYQITIEVFVDQRISQSLSNFKENYRNETKRWQ